MSAQMNVFLGHLLVRNTSPSSPSESGRMQPELRCFRGLRFVLEHLSGVVFREASFTQSGSLDDVFVFSICCIVEQFGLRLGSV